MKNLREFTTKEELFIYLKENKKQIMSERKSQIKYADAIDFVNIRLIDKSDFAVKEVTTPNSTDSGVITKNIVINTTNLMDSHLDVHIPGLWKKTISEQKSVYHLKSHLRDFEYVISDNAIPFTKNMNWTDLGYDAEGKTQALIFKSEIHKDRNEFMYNQYLNGYVKQHSVGMRYVNDFMCVNSEEKYWTEEKANWDKYYPEIVNKEMADEYGFFFAVTEAKLVEGSAVLFGSNPITPTLNTKQEPSNTQTEPIDTQKQAESRQKDTFNEELKELFKLKLN